MCICWTTSAMKNLHHGLPHALFGTCIAWGQQNNNLGGGLPPGSGSPAVHKCAHRSARGYPVRLMERTAVGPCTAAATAVMLPETRRLLSATEWPCRALRTRHPNILPTAFYEEDQDDEEDQGEKGIQMHRVWNALQQVVRSTTRLKPCLFIPTLLVICMFPCLVSTAHWPVSSHCTQR